MIRKISKLLLSIDIQISAMNKCFKNIRIKMEIYTKNKKKKIRVILTEENTIKTLQ